MPKNSFLNTSAPPRGSGRISGSIRDLQREMMRHRPIAGEGLRTTQTANGTILSLTPIRATGGQVQAVWL
jgi:hypothetical protein